MQVIQADNEVLAQLVQQLQKLRQLLNAQIQAQRPLALNKSSVSQREDAALENFMIKCLENYFNLYRVSDCRCSFVHRL